MGKVCDSTTFKMLGEHLWTYALKRCCLTLSRILDSRRKSFVLLILVVILLTPLPLYLILTPESGDSAAVMISMNEENCPNCHGVSSCRDIDDGVMVPFNTPLLLSRIYNAFTSQSNKIIYEITTTKEKVVMEKRTSEWRFKTAKRLICQRSMRKQKMRPIETCKLDTLLPESDWKTFFYTFLLLNADQLCLSERLLNSLSELYGEKEFLNLRANEKRTFLYTWAVDPGTLLTQAFPQTDGWPFPLYYGSCGQWIASEYVGPTLNNFIRAPWQRRANFAYQLLRMGHVFTQNEAEFNFYMMNMTLGQFAVRDSDDTVLMIDLNNLLIVDRQRVEVNPHGYTKKQKVNMDSECSTESENCSEKFTRNSLCGTMKSDYNIYAVCREIFTEPLPQGGFQLGPLINNLPAGTAEETLTVLLWKCLNPTSDQDRFIIAGELAEFFLKSAKI